MGLRRWLAERKRKKVTSDGLDALFAIISEHLENAARYQREGGYTSSVLREIRTFERQLRAIEDVLNRYP